jgi:hypothetical protein
MMTLENWQSRLAEVEKAITEITQRRLKLLLHKNEIEFQIEVLTKIDEAAKKAADENSQSTVAPEETLPLA